MCLNGRSCNTLLSKCQPHPIRLLSDVTAHEGMPPIKFHVCHQTIVSASCFSGKLHRRQCQRSGRDDLWAASCFTLRLPSCFFLWCAWVMSLLGIHLDHLLMDYIYSVCALRLTLLWLLAALLPVKHLHDLILLQWSNLCMLFLFTSATTVGD